MNWAQDWNQGMMDSFGCVYLNVYLVGPNWCGILGANAKTNNLVWDSSEIWYIKLAEFGY